MAAKNIFKKEMLKEDGQALMEFVLFLPFMMMMYFTILAIGNSINGSINQQKATRGYFYYRASNNSTIPRPRRDGGQEPSDSWRTFGMQIMGWADKFENESTPVSPCYKFSLPFASDEADKCNDSYSKKTTQFIRVTTVYGVCGATYTKEGTNQNVRQPDGSSPNLASSAGACTIVE